MSPPQWCSQRWVPTCCGRDEPPTERGLSDLSTVRALWILHRTVTRHSILLPVHGENLVDTLSSDPARAILTSPRLRGEGRVRGRNLKPCKCARGFRSHLSGPSSALRAPSPRPRGEGSKNTLPAARGDGLKGTAPGCNSIHNAPNVLFVNARQRSGPRDSPPRPACGERAGVRGRILDTFRCKRGRRSPLSGPLSGLRALTNCSSMARGGVARFCRHAM